MLGNILIDKLEFCASIPDLEKFCDKQEFWAKIETVLSERFPENAYFISEARNRIKISLTPTRYVIPNRNFTDINLEMPSENWLCDLFSELGLYNNDLKGLFNIVKLHLTKNIITENKPSVYMNNLANIKYSRMKAQIIKSNATNETLTISTQKIIQDKKSVTGDRQFIFYDKAQQLFDDRGLKELRLKNDLTSEEQNLISVQHYNASTRTLNLVNLNILRCELQYKFSGKLKKIENFILGNNSSQFSLATFLDSLEQKRLYEELNSFYKKELRDYVFRNEPSTNSAKLTGYEGLFAEFIQNVNVKQFQALYNEYLLGKSFKEQVKKVQTHVQNDLYAELYEKLGLG